MLDVCPTASDAPVSSPTEMPSSDKRDEGPELARNGHPDCSARCPLSGAKRKHILAVSFSGFDPHRRDRISYSGSLPGTPEERAIRAPNPTRGASITPSPRLSGDLINHHLTGNAPQ